MSKSTAPYLFCINSGSTVWLECSFLTGRFDYPASMAQTLRRGLAKQYWPSVSARVLLRYGPATCDFINHLPTYRFSFLLLRITFTSPVLHD